MSPLPEDQQLRWSVSPSGSKLDSLKHVFNLLSFQERSRAEVYTVKSPQQLYFIQWGIKAWLVWRWCEAAFFCCRCHEIELRLNRSSARYARNGAPSSIRHLIVGLLQTSKTRVAGLRVQKNLDGSKEHGLMFWFFFLPPLPAPCPRSHGRGPTECPSPAKSRWSTPTPCWRSPASSRTTREDTSAWPRTGWARTRPPGDWPSTVPKHSHFLQAVVLLSSHS